MSSRAVWLARPWFLASVVLLALNDHVFKAAWPGWVTGKLSDFAGLVVVGTLASVLLGHRWGTVLAGLAFVSLKTVPGVAEAVAPLLGGVTQRDASDLVALLMLIPLWLLLSRKRPGDARRSRRAWQAIGLVLAVLATTATSKVDPPTEDYLSSVGWARDGYFYALVHSVADNEARYLRSGDGGMTWTPTTEPSRLYAKRSEEQVWQDCANDGVCYRVTAKDLDARPKRTAMLRVMERRLPGQDWVTETVFGEQDPGFDLLVVNLANSRQVVLTIGEGRVLYRAGYGDYRQVDVMAHYHGRR